jgi:adenylate cyclase
MCWAWRKPSRATWSPSSSSVRSPCAARTLLERRLSQAPLLLLVEDLHWADTASLDLLRGAADQLVDRPLMFLLTHRPEAKPPMVARAEQTILRLGPLSTSDTRAMVDGLFGDVIGDPLGQIGDIVVSRAGGNPLFVEEIVRMLVARGVLVREGDRWASPASCQEVDVPPTLQGLLLSRIDKLGPEERRLLQEAAVLGVDFDEAVLRAVATAPGTRSGASWRLISCSRRARPRGRALPLCPCARPRRRVPEPSAHAAHGDARAGRAGPGAGGGRAPGALERPRSAGPPLESQRRQGPRRALSARRGRLGPRCVRERRRHPPLRRARRILADCPAARRTRWPPGSGSAICWASPAGGPRRSRTTRRCAGRRRRGATARPPRACTGRSAALHWDAGIASALEPASPPAWAPRRGGDAIERAHLFQEMGRLAFRAATTPPPSSGRRRRWRGHRRIRVGRGGVAATEAERAREAAAVRVHASLNTLGVALAPHRLRPTEAVEQIEPQRRRCERGA